MQEVEFINLDNKALYCKGVTPETRLYLDRKEDRWIFQTVDIHNQIITFVDHNNNVYHSLTRVDNEWNNKPKSRANQRKRWFVKIQATIADVPVVSTKEEKQESPPISRLFFDDDVEKKTKGL